MFLAGKLTDAPQFGEPGSLGFKSHEGQKVGPSACTELLLSFLWIKLRPLKHCTKHKWRADWGGGTCSLGQEISLSISNWGVGEKKNSPPGETITTGLLSCSPPVWIYTTGRVKERPSLRGWIQMSVWCYEAFWRSYLQPKPHKDPTDKSLKVLKHLNLKHSRKQCTMRKNQQVEQTKQTTEVRQPLQIMKTSSKYSLK